MLDFGLAKALGKETPEDSAPASHASPTMTMGGTVAGMILGTAAYMAPEQAAGTAVDRRADIWAFGVVLFEMLSGKMLYPGRTVSDTLAGVLAREPEWQQLPADTPLPVRRLLERCLHKEASERLQAIGEVRIAIRRYLADPQAETTAHEATVASADPARGRPRLLVAALPLIVLGAALAWLLKPGPPPPRPLHVEASVAVEQIPLMRGIASAVVLSRDGSQLAYVTGVGTNPTGKIRVRDTHRIEARYLTGTERGYNLFFSPDGRWLGYVTPTELMKVAISGGAPLKLCRVNRSRGANWGEDGTIVFAMDPSSGLYRISAAGGEPEALTELAEGEISHRWPQFLPGQTHVLYTAYTSANSKEGIIKILDLSTGQSELIHSGGTYARYAASGHLLFWREATIFAARFDAKRREMTTLPAPVVQQVSGNYEGGAHFDVADNGTLVYLPGGASRTVEVKRTIQWIDRSGALTETTGVTGEYGAGLSMRPDLSQAAVTRWLEGNGDVWILDLERETQTRLTFHEGTDFIPLWSPDGSIVYYGSRRGPLYQMYRKPADGSTETEQVQSGEHDQFVSDISSDGTRLLYRENHPDTGDDLWVLPLDSDGDPEPFLVTRFEESDARFSPDGRWIAYQSDESGNNEIFVRPYPGPGGKWQISTDGGQYPRWAADGSRVFYLNENKIYEADVAADGRALKVGRDEAVASLDPAFNSRSDWVVAPDGDRFAFIQDPPGSTAELAGENHALIRFTFSWFEELEELLADTR